MSEPNEPSNPSVLHVASIPKRRAVYTGSFDPFHLGHENIARRAASLFDELVIGVGINPDKHSLFPPQARVEMIRAVLQDLPNITVESFSGLTVKFVRKHDSRILLRGIRALADIEYEFTMSLTNSCLDTQLETVFLMSQKEYTHLSSGLIRQIAGMGGDLQNFVPPAVKLRLSSKFADAIEAAR